MVMRSWRVHRNAQKRNEANLSALLDLITHRTSLPTLTEQRTLTQRRFDRCRVRLFKEKCAFPDALPNPAAQISTVLRISVLRLMPSRRAKGVSPGPVSEFRRAVSFPAPEISTQTERAAASAA